MRKLLLLPILALLLTACIPQLVTSPIAELSAYRDGSTYTATLLLTENATQVLVLLRSDDAQERNVLPRLERGLHSFSIESDAPVACSASGYVGWTYFLVFCPEPE